MMSAATIWLTACGPPSVWAETKVTRRPGSTSSARSTSRRPDALAARRKCLLTIAAGRIREEPVALVGLRARAGRSEPPSITAGAPSLAPRQQDDALLEVDPRPSLTFQ